MIRPIIEWADQIECPIIRQLFIDNETNAPSYPGKIVYSLDEALSYSFKWIYSPQRERFWIKFQDNHSLTYEDLKEYDMCGIIPDIKPKEPKRSTFAKFIDKIETK